MLATVIWWGKKERWSSKRWFVLSTVCDLGQQERPVIFLTSDHDRLTSAAISQSLSRPLAVVAKQSLTWGLVSTTGNGSMGNTPQCLREEIWCNATVRSKNTWMHSEWNTSVVESLTQNSFVLCVSGNLSVYFLYFSLSGLVTLSWWSLENKNGYKHVPQV